MLETKAAFRRKDTEIETTDCVIDKVIHLSGSLFDRFSHDLMRDWSFIRDNKIDNVVDSEGRFHCLLVTGENRRDGILVNSEGADYARYTAFIPNAEDLLTVGRYSALTELNKKLTGIVDYIAQPEERSYIVDLHDIETKFGVDLMYNGALMNTVLGMLGERPEISDFELDKNELTVYRDTDSLEQAAAGIPERGANDKPSVMEQIKAARQSSGEPQEANAIKHKKSKGAPEL